MSGSITQKLDYKSTVQKILPSNDGTVSDQDFYGHVGISGNGLVMVIASYGDDDGGDFISFQKAQQYTWSAMSQMYQAIKSQQAEIESLKRKAV